MEEKDAYKLKVSELCPRTMTFGLEALEETAALPRAYLYDVIARANSRGGRTGV